MSKFIDKGKSAKKDVSTYYSRPCLCAPVRARARARNKRTIILVQTHKMCESTTLVVVNGFFYMRHSQKKRGNVRCMRVLTHESNYGSAKALNYTFCSKKNLCKKPLIKQLSY